MSNEASSKPATVEVGQRWVEHDAACTAYTVTAVSEHGAQIAFDDGTDTCGHWYPLRDILTDRYLGGPSTPMPDTGKAPAPAKGQRWRSAGHGPDATFVITAIECDRIRFHWEGGIHFARTGEDDGASLNFLSSAGVSFVDHGEPASPPSQPRTGPNWAKCTRADCFEARVPHSHRQDGPTTWSTRYDDIGIPPKPAPLTALQILQSRERARQAKREEDARAVAAFVDFFDCLPDAP